MMPGGSGLDLLKFVRSNPRFQKLPFLLLTTENDKDTIMQAIKLGVSAYLLKPWIHGELVAKIEACWKKHYPS
jgi:two-component system chemotaxis response regulator CheY